MKLGFLYAGQGSQHAGMGADLYEAFSAFRAVYDHAEVDFDLKKVTFEDVAGAEEEKGELQEIVEFLRDPKRFLELAFAAGMTAVLREKGITPAVAAGLSLGEYSALHAAGVFDAATAIRLVAFRGKAMEEAAAGRESAMMAVLNLDRSPLQDACDAASDLGCVVIANYNCPGQCQGEGRPPVPAPEGQRPLPHPPDGPCRECPAGILPGRGVCGSPDPRDLQLPGGCEG